MSSEVSWAIQRSMVAATMAFWGGAGGAISVTDERRRRLLSVSSSSEKRSSSGVSWGRSPQMTNRGSFFGTAENAEDNRKVVSVETAERVLARGMPL